MNRILVIEDDASVREEILRILRFEDYEAVGAASGTEGLELADRERPDCILCDLLMPELNGFETLARLRARSETAATPIIFITARTAREDIRIGMDMGADDYITKPFTAEELLSAVSGRLQRRMSLEEVRERKFADLRDTITAALPHEFRTPLTVVLGFAELLERQAQRLTADEISEIARDMQAAGKRLEHLVENFLLYAEIELLAADRGAQDARAAAEIPDHAVAAIVEQSARRAAARAGREADLRVVIEPDVTVRMGAAELDRVVRELAGNAFKFSHPGSMVTVSAAPDRASDELVVSVSDHGRGMSPEEIASVGALTQFRRRIHEQQGSGLGLVIAKRLVEINGGRLAIESVPGRSATITFRLPLA